MLPGNIDPRRPEKQQRYKPPPASNNAAPGEDLTPDYMNILDSQRKSMQTPRSDRFKVVKIESTEPFKRGRWKCMDFLDQSYAKVFQQNYNNRSSEGRPPSPKNNEPTNIHTCASWSNTASYVDLQSSMLQIFYRQNSLENQNQCSCSTNGNGNSNGNGNGQDSISIGSACCDESHKYQNHVLMPGMVSSSFVGLDFPIEFNFIPDNPGHLPSIFKEHMLNANNNQCLINHLECCCKNQTSNVDIQKFHQNMSSEQVTIQPTQISNYAQISPDLIQKNLNVPPQELLNQSSGINYVQNLIPNDPNKSVRNFPNQQTSVLKEDQIIDNNNSQNNGVHKVQQIISQQNYIAASSQANGTTELNKSQFNNNNPIYVNIQNLTCPQKSININESTSTSKNLISDQQITSTSTEAPNSVSVSLVGGAARVQDPQNNNNKTALENICDSTTETMAQNNQANGNYVSHSLLQNSNETVSTEYIQNLVQNLDPNNPNLVQKFVVPNGNIVQNCVSPNGNNVHYIVYSANSNTIQPSNNNGNGGNCVQKTQNGGSTTNATQNFVPSSGSYVQNIVQNTVNASQNLITNNENVNLIQSTNGANNQIVTSKGNSNQNLPQINNQSGSNPNLIQNSEKITQNVNLYQGQISVVEASSCTYKQQSVPQQEVTPLYQNSQNSIANSLPSNTCIHAFLTEERTLVQNTNAVDNQGGKLVSNLPVDTKIEALMDLVKKHLKCTVMEDVNVLKHKILELKERIAQLEYENELLKNQYKRNSMQ